MIDKNSTSQNPAPVKCLVIQLARLGDTLQSLMALRAAKQLYPQLEFTFIAREKFAAAVQRVPWIKKVITFPTDEILAGYINQSTSEQETIAGLAQWTSPICNEDWDLLLNWTFSEASSFLTALVPAKIKLGYSRKNDLTIHCGDGWSQYVQGVVQGGSEQNIHLTDILTTQLLTALQITVGDPGQSNNAKVSSKTFFTLNGSLQHPAIHLLDPRKRTIGIQLGAGNEKKIWPIENWAKLLTQMIEEFSDVQFLILGGKEDESRAEELIARLDDVPGSEERVISVVGDSDFDLWATLIGRADWVIAGDTAATHLASILGTRIINLSIGPVKLNETGPYGNGHYVIQPRDQKTIDPRFVVAIWMIADREDRYRFPKTSAQLIEERGLNEELKGVRVFRSRIRGLDEGGGIVYENTLSDTMEIEDWMSMTIGHTARSWYCGWTPELGLELSRAALNPALLNRLRQLAEAGHVLKKIFTEARNTSTVLGWKSSRLKSDKVMSVQNRDELRELGKKLIELEGLAEKLLVTEPLLSAYVQMGRVLMHNLQGDHLADLGKQSATSYRQLEEGIDILLKWIEHSLELSKPRAITTPQPRIEPEARV